MDMKFWNLQLELGSEVTTEVTPDHDADRSPVTTAGTALTETRSALSGAALRNEDSFPVTILAETVQIQALPVEVEAVESLPEPETT